MSNKIIGLVMNTSMHLSHDGLRQTAKDNKLNVDKLAHGEFILFCNRPFTAFKIFGANNSIFYHRAKENRALNPRALMAAIECFDGVKIDYTTALAAEIEKSLSPELRAFIKRRRELKIDKMKPGVRRRAA